ncbi:MAG: PH domain-containing protein [Firmicutes bacterium]|nr:PH domain-containing protein [Bacillota bacterium]
MENNQTNQNIDKEAECLFSNILEKGEVVVRAYKPNRKAVWWSVLFPILVIPTNWPFLPIILPIVLLVMRAYLNKRAYAVTDRRILVRGGIIGVDYKSLKINSINATTVRVGFIDNAAKQNTGTIEFGSPSTPIGMVNANGTRNPFMFVYIKNPYDELREIQEHIDAVQDAEKK